jgi:hypothetical protein
MLLFGLVRLRGSLCWAIWHLRRILGDRCNSKDCRISAGRRRRAQEGAGQVHAAACLHDIFSVCVYLYPVLFYEFHQIGLMKN